MSAGKLPNCGAAVTHTREELVGLVEQFDRIERRMRAQLLLMTELVEVAREFADRAEVARRPQVPGSGRQLPACGRRLAAVPDE